MVEPMREAVNTELARQRMERAVRHQNPHLYSIGDQDEGPRNTTDWYIFAVMCDVTIKGIIKTQ